MNEKIKNLVDSIEVFQYPVPLCFSSKANVFVTKSDFDRVVKELTIDKVYLVKYSQGSYDDYECIDIFVTFDEEIAINYMNRFNYLIEEYKNFYSRFEEDTPYGYRWIKDEYDDYYNRWSWLRRTNKCFIVEMEIR